MTESIDLQTRVLDIPPVASPSPREAELIPRILAGEKDAYYDLIAPYQRVVYVTAFSILRNEVEAEDCAQDALLKAFHHLQDFKGNSRFGTWLVRITLNEAKMKLRKMRPRAYEVLDESTDNQDDEYVPQSLCDWREIPSEALERKEVREMLETAIKALPTIYREVFVLRDMQEQNVTTTALLLGVSEAVVKTRLLRARLQLRDLLAPAVKSSAVFTRNGYKKGKNPWL